MNRTTRHRYTISVVAATLLGVIWAGGAAGASAGQGAGDATAAVLVAESGRAGGLVAVVGPAKADLPLAIARRGAFAVHALVKDRATCGTLREAIHDRGAYGPVSAGVLAGDRLPYADNLLTVAIVASWPTAGARDAWLAEVRRVLAPLGTALIHTSTSAGDLAAACRKAGFEAVSAVDAGPAGAYVRARKPWPADIDEWTHYLHAADGNPVARDTVVGPPQRYQWRAGPEWMQSHETDSSVSTLVTARGRLFTIENHAPTSLPGPESPPDAWFLVARDAFNGVLLWQVPIRRWGWREWKPSWFNTRPGDVPLNLQKRLVAVRDKVYVTLGYQAPVSQLDARTGAILQTYAGTERTNEVLHAGDTLILSVLDGDGVKVMTVDATTGKRLWQSGKTYRGTTVDYIRWKAMRGATEPAKLDPAPNIATDGKDAVALIDGPNVVCLDYQTGRQRWSTAFPSDPADETAGGMKAGGNLWNGSVLVTGGVVLHASPSRLAALDAKTGNVLWHRPKAYIGHLWYEWKDIFVIDGLVWTWGEDLTTENLERGSGKHQRSRFPQYVNGYDLKTGEVTEKVSLGPVFKAHHHHRCYRNKATLRYILASRRGTEFVDLTGGPHTIHNWVRGTCHVGMMPANGLQYAPPHPCVCYIEEKLNGLLALAPAASGKVPAASPPTDPSRLQRGPAYGHIRHPTSNIPDDADWPAFRRDALRTGSVETEVPAAAKPLWQVQAGGRVSPPIAVGDRVFAAVIDAHQVVCLDTADGRTVWRFTAGGRVDSPPTYHAGTVLFGSADGAVTCLRAADGALVWRFRAAPRERLIGVHGQVESAWPVSGSVLVMDAAVYFAAGRSSELDGGIHLYALDAATGAVRHHRVLEGPRYRADQIDENYQLPMGALAGVLMSDGSHIHMRYETFGPDLARAKGKPALQPAAGFLDANYFKRTPWRYGGLSDWGRLIVHDNRSVYYVRMFDSLLGLSPNVYFTPGAKGYLLFARHVGDKKQAWSQRVPVRVRAMVATTGRLFVAGPPDVVDPDDPLGAFEGRKGGRLYAVDAATGERTAEHALASPPVFNGMAAARGRLYVVQEDGRIVCFGP